MATKKQPQRKSVAKDDRVLIVIPYLAAEAQGREIELCIAGWRRHFKTPYHIAVVGDDPHIAGDDITHIPCPRVKPIAGQYLPHLDINNRFRVAREAFPATKGFIFSCDDYYAVGDFDLAFVKKPKNKGEDIIGAPFSHNGFEVDKYKTHIALQDAGLPCVNWTTHLPQYFEWKKLETLWTAYDMMHNSYVVEDLYYNTYSRGKALVITENPETDTVKCGVYRRDIDRPNKGRSKTGLDYLREAVEGSKIWITNSPAGYSPALEKFLADYYGL